ncbi:ABC transporter permease subunit [Aerococcaceae bacterium DSM 111020]|nr:ABC transporter permease subunit [Aerococcaceae bacterium DSM 111020]
MSISKTKTTIKKQKIENPIINTIVHLLSYILGFIYATPVILVILFSFMNTEGIATNTLSFSNFTFEHYRSILNNPNNYQPFVTSIVFSALASIVAVLFMLLLARWVITNKDNKFVQIIEFIYYIPWLLPALFIALGLIIGYAVPHPLIFGNSVIGALWPLPVAYMITMLPTTLPYIKSAYYSFDNNLKDASRILGASSIRTFSKVVIPALLLTALALIALNFNGKLADYDLSAFLYHPNYPTLGIVIRLAADPNANINAKAINLVYSVLLMIISTLIMYFLYGRGTKISERQGGIQ